MYPNEFRDIYGNSTPKHELNSCSYYRAIRTRMLVYFKFII